MKPRVLHVITVYNGRAFVPRAIKSAVEMDQSTATIDVLVLDDASPEPGWSEELETLCKALGANYYLTPRNLGIPRNVSLGLLTAIEKNYDYVTINNSDVIFPKNLIATLVECCKQKNVGSVTAWSNNVSIYSIPNSDPDLFVSSQETVDFLSDSLAKKFSSTVMDIPAGISFCIMMPVSVVKDVGVMDPIFGRGYCEETDWSLRSLKMGYRVCLAPGTFVYHMGRGSNLAAGLVSGAHSTVPENEIIIDMRYPEFRRQVSDFQSSGEMELLKSNAIEYLLDEAARRFGYAIVPEWVRPSSDIKLPPVKIEVATSSGSPTLKFSYAGFVQVSSLENNDAVSRAVERFGVRSLVYDGYGAISSKGIALKLSNGRGVKYPYPSDIW
ncbi:MULTISPECIES: glycosyltransferase [unclassified Rhizobium]|uniref:glycosyltransferase family 2 protein n=1 Tax=unclassified Rhizobium TaxID=2613769 RepID=UPI0011A1E99D|nr:MULTISPECIES: glycosyltransferase [unclassified Rhizobium]QYA13659.1 glycosyltransferase family 2 protein [Rhizobium sp. AB2/73]TWB51653.1 GT2 family glycosyltransferase [Rhizobium sp. ERR 922]TWB94075.1 GT2 family glycosyltransferase [Rhizobium sp. ERR 942]UEQ80411.1 glycosyltransferase family 2 protein [Rhizobium sp. AB2/73]